MNFASLISRAAKTTNNKQQTQLPISTIETFIKSQKKETVSSLNEEIDRIKKEIELERKRQNEELKTIKYLLNKSFQPFNTKDITATKPTPTPTPTNTTYGATININASPSQNIFELEDKELSQHNKLLEILIDYNIEFCTNGVTIENEKEMINYSFRGECGNNKFFVGFCVSSDEGKKAPPSIHRLIINVPYMFLLNFRQIINHCIETKSISLFLQSFRKLTKACFKRNQFFGLLSRKINKSLKEQKGEGEEEKEEEEEENCNNYISKNTVSILGGYYSNSLIHHPNFLPIFHLIWNIKYDEVYERVNNEIVVAAIDIYSKETIEKIEEILHQLTIHNCLSNPLLNSLVNLITNPQKQQFN